MGQPAARQGDAVNGIDVHIIVNPSGVPVPTPLPFTGQLTDDLSRDVMINGLPAATVGSGAVNSPPHIPAGGTFTVPPMNRGTVTTGSATVLINGRPAARAGDSVMTCQDVPGPPATITSTSTVLIG
jgi:uncharacterized Zn-binding protein involved in type VI secretion